MQFARGQTGADDAVRLGSRLPVEDGVVLEGTLPDASVTETQRSGLYIESGPSGLLHPDRTRRGDRVWNRLPGGEREREDIMNRERVFAGEAQFRLLLKHAVLELYIDDLYMQSAYWMKLQAG